ncbi:FtsW/RodA/SpoVE family cell cycle protein [Virgibacillus siamensis]|uniref:FtsW/RodA/SpoVE family cell cycle protein n=1 Tax=Virgibacillus siamensis TaxID=480071 RepID=UPI0009866F9C|nr:FtsW/RodA/SpoVE family cell cycle protein [Virgibacillus siamensis]
MSKQQSYYIQTDFLVLLTLFICVSLLSIYNAQQLPQFDGDSFVVKQLAWFAAGMIAAAFILLFDLDQLYKASLLIYGIGIFVLVILLISPPSIAPVIKGQQSWFTLPGLSMQPSEFTKMTTILYLAAVISSHKEKYTVTTIKSDIMLLLKIAFFTGVPVLLIMMQPDFGTSMVYIFFAAMLVLLAGIDWKIIAGLVLSISLLAGGALALIINFPEISQDTLGLDPYQIDRIMTWINPDEQGEDDTYHVDKSMLALGSGQLLGKGMDNLEVGTPEAHTDFIFSVIGESFGFLGTAGVIFLYFLLMYKLVTLGLNISGYSSFGAYVSFGFMSILLIHTFQNIAMTIGIMPITGIPLLLISYGGSSILATMIGLGLVYRVAVEYTIQQDYLF